MAGVGAGELMMIKVSLLFDVNLLCARRFSPSNYESFGKTYKKKFYREQMFRHPVRVLITCILREGSKFNIGKSLSREVAISAGKYLWDENWVSQLDPLRTTSNRYY